MAPSSSTIVAAGPPPPGQVSDFVHPPSISYKLTIANAVCVSLGMLAVIIRLYTRSRLVGSIRVDDCRNPFSPLAFQDLILCPRSGGNCYGAMLVPWDRRKLTLERHLLLQIALLHKYVWSRPEPCRRSQILIFIPETNFGLGVHTWDIPYPSFQIFLKV